MNINLDDLLKMTGRTVRAELMRHTGHGSTYEYGLIGVTGVLITTRYEWQDTGVKTKSAAEARKGNCTSVLLNRSAAVLEAEAEKLLEKAKKLRQMAMEANS